MREGNAKLATIQLTETGTKKLGIKQDAEYELYKYCKDCEKYFSELEYYCSRILNEKVVQEDPLPPKKNQPKEIKCFEADYPKIKKFVLSLVLRASKSQKPDFADFKVGNHERRIKNIVFADNVPGQYIYPIVINRHDQDKVDSYSTAPFFHSYNGERMIFLFIGEYMIWVFLTTKKSKVSIDLEEFILKDNGILPIPITNKPFLENIWNASRI